MADKSHGKLFSQGKYPRFNLQVTCGTDVLAPPDPFCLTKVLPGEREAVSESPAEAEEGPVTGSGSPSVSRGPRPANGP